MLTSPRQCRLIRRHVLAATVAVTGLIGLSAGAASAHIDPDPPTVPAGSSVTVGFGVEHGCDGSNTTQLVFQIPAGVIDAAAVDKPGWTTSAAGDTVTFAGGNLDASTPETFSLTFTAPAVTGTLRFPIIQTCVVGELAWIEEAAPGAAEPEHPAPEVVVAEGPTTPAAPVTTSAETASPATSVTPATASSDSAGNAGLVIGLTVAAVMVIGGAVLIARRRGR